MSVINAMKLILLLQMPAKCLHCFGWILSASVMIYFLMSHRCWASAEDGRRFSSPHGPQHGDRSHACTGKLLSNHWPNTVLVTSFLITVWENMWEAWCDEKGGMVVGAHWGSRPRKKDGEDIERWEWLVRTELCVWGRKPDWWLSRMVGIKRIKRLLDIQ